MPSSIRVRGIGRRSARPPYSTLWATLLAAETTKAEPGRSGLGISSMGEKYRVEGPGRGWAHSLFNDRSSCHDPLRAGEGLEAVAFVERVRIGGGDQRA